MKKKYILLLLLSHLPILAMKLDLTYEGSAQNTLSFKTITYLQSLAQLPATCTDPKEVAKALKQLYRDASNKIANRLDSKEEKSGRTPLHLAILEEHVILTEALINCGASLDLQDNNGNTPLHLAVLKEHIVLVKTLIDYGASVNIQNNKEDTPLHFALYQRDKNLALLLLRYKPDCSISNKRGQTVMDLAKDWKDEEIISQIKKLLINPIFSASNIDYAWLLENVFDSQEELENWIQRQTNLTKVSRNSWTLLHSAAESGLTKFIAYLIEKGANIHEKSFAGYTPLYFAIFSGHIPTVKLLIEHGAEVNDAQGPCQDTPLHIAVRANNFKMVKLLLSEGAKINALNKHSQTPLLLLSVMGKKILPTTTDLRTFILIHENGGTFTLEPNSIETKKQFLLYSIYKAVMTNDIDTLRKLSKRRCFSNTSMLYLLINNALNTNIDNDIIEFLTKLLIKNSIDAEDKYLSLICIRAIQTHHATLIDIIKDLKPDIFNNQAEFDFLIAAIESQNNSAIRTFANNKTALIIPNWADTAIQVAINEKNIYAVQLLLNLNPTYYSYKRYYDRSKRHFWSSFIWNGYEKNQSPIGILLGRYKAKHDEAATKIQKAFRKYMSKQSDCSICLDKGCNMKTECYHSFHEECIMEWLKTKNTCPLCRHKLIKQ